MLPFLLLLLSLTTLISSQQPNYPPLPLTPCENALISLFQGTNPNTGAIINAMGKSVNNLGNFDECLQINDTRYCILSGNVENGGEKLPFLVGWCVPFVCNGTELENAFDTFFRKNISELFFGENVALRIKFLLGGMVVQTSDPYPINTPPGIPKLEALCPDYKENKLPISVYVVLSVIFMFALLTLTGSLVDYYLPNDEDRTKIEHKPIKYDHEPSESDTQTEGNMVSMKDMSQVSDEENIDLEESEVSPVSFGTINRDMFGVKLLLAFSILYNLKSLAAKERSTETQFLNGIRVLSIFYVMLGHTNVFMLVSPVLDFFHVFMEVWKRLSFQIILAGFYAVDTFFFLSGFLVCLALLDLLKKGKVNWFLVFFHRWWRLTPLYFLVIWISTYFTLNLLSDGPLSKIPNSIFLGPSTTCEDTWYLNILYVNNFFPWEDGLNRCVVWGWYLANDMQFFLITPLFLALYLKNKKIGIIVAFTFLLASFIGVGTYLGVNKMSLGDPNWFKNYYIKPWSRVGPYFIGCFLAVLWKEKGAVKIRPWFRFLAYLCASILLLTTVFGTYTNVENTWGITENVFFYTFGRTGFIVGLAIFCYLMLNNQADFIRTILSYHYWTPLARLSYGAYLLHPIVMISTYTSTRVALSWDIWSVSVYYCGFIILTFGLSFVFWIIFEKPLSNLESVIISSLKFKEPI